MPVGLVYTGVFGLGAAMAAASGVLYEPRVGVDHTLGLGIILKAFIAVVVGRMGNLSLRRVTRSPFGMVRRLPSGPGAEPVEHTGGGCQPGKWQAT